MQSRKNINNEKDPCRGCPLYNECHLRKLPLDKRLTYCLSPKTIWKNALADLQDSLIMAKETQREFWKESFELANKRLEQERKNPADATLGLIKVSYNEVVKKAFEISTDNREAKICQRALVRARTDASRILKKKIPVPLWAYTFNVFLTEGKITSVGFSDHP